MPDQPSESSDATSQDSITVADAIRLKHSLNTSIQWGNSNLNALEVEQLTRLKAEDYARVRADYAKWNGYHNFAMLGAFLACLVGYFYLDRYYPHHFWLQLPLMIVGFLCFYALVKREGHAEGYIDGYDAGHEAGIHKALGIKPEEFTEMHEMATNIKIDSMIIKKLDERTEGQRKDT